MKTITKTKTIKKMSNGGNPPDGLSGKIGKGVSIGGVLAGSIKMIGDAIKKRRAVVQGANAIKAGNPKVKRKDAIKASQNFINNPVPKEKRGGAIKRKYQNGGSSQKGMYNTSSSGQDRTTSGSTYGGSPQAKRGGSIKSKTKK